MADRSRIARWAGVPSFIRAIVARCPLPAAVPLAALAVHRLPSLPSALWSALAVVLALIILLSGRVDRRRLARFALLFVAAMAWTSYRASIALDERIEPAQEGIDFLVMGHVSAMPRDGEYGTRFSFWIDQCLNRSGAEGGAIGRAEGSTTRRRANHRKAADPDGDASAGAEASNPVVACPSKRTVVLTWYRTARGSDSETSVSTSPTPRLDLVRPLPGERWQLLIRLKRPHGLLNPGGFDSELRALQEGTAALGYVRSPKHDRFANRRLVGKVWSLPVAIEALRTRIRDAMLDTLAQRRTDAAGVLVALSVGDQAAIAPSWWEIFNRTAVSHLMSISGLHITMLAAMAGAATRRMLRWHIIGRPALLLRCPADRLCWLVALVVAFAYSALAGWGIPAQRTVWMLAVAGFAMTTRRSGSLGAVLALAAAIVTIVDPWAPLAAGFWLSFASVGAICWYGMASGMRQRLQKAAGAARRRWLLAVIVEATRTQWAATLALLPLGAWYFASFSLVGPIANAFAIPIVSALVTPAALLGAALTLPFPMLAGSLLGVVCEAVGWLLDALAWLALPRWAIAPLAMPGLATLLSAAAAVLVLLAPMRVPARPAAVAALVPLLATPAPRLAPGSLSLTALDVGQGAAVLVETPGGRLLFDAGPRQGADSDAGARIIAPYLRSRGIRRLDALVVSHGDDDHAGGSASLIRALPIDRVFSSMRADDLAIADAATHERCWRGLHWQWGEVRFEFLHPGPERTSRRSTTNASSCVLRIQSPAGSILLTGDIEAAQERFLVEKFGAARLRTDVLIAPHHGSNGSSSMPFLQAVQPAMAIAQAGYRNRFGHPGRKALVRYRIHGVQMLRTDRDGAISIEMAAQAPRVPAAIKRLRIDDRRYWRIRVDDARAR